VPSTSPRPYEPLRKCRVAWQGLRFALRDKGVAYTLVVSLILLAIAFTQRAWADLELLLVATALVLASELINTAIEELCDYVQPEAAPQIGATKDIAAAGVGVCVLAWAGVILLETWRLLIAWQS